MKKRNNTKKIAAVPVQNPVAKFAHQFNKALVYADKIQYRRNAKHRKQDASLNILDRVLREVACFIAIAYPNNIRDDAVFKIPVWARW